MSDIRLTLAIGDYDHTRDLAMGRVRPSGIDLTVLNLGVEEIFYRFHDRLEWEVSELSMGMYSSAASRGDARFIALPVFPSRVFRHSSFYVRAESKLRGLEDLAGKRIGLPQWSQTATIYARGLLSDTVGIPLTGIRWVQAGVNEAGRMEPATLKLPPGITIEAVRDRSLDDMLVAGDLDAVISARPPRSFVSGSGRIIRLVDNHQAAEERYFAETGIFPIMHTVVLRRDVYEANRWIARNLMTAFEQAKERSVARLMEASMTLFPLAWSQDLARDKGMGLLFRSGNYWPYGVAPNRRTLDAFLRYAFEQGVCHRQLAAEEIFAPEALAEIRV